MSRKSPTLILAAAASLLLPLAASAATAHHVHPMPTNRNWHGPTNRGTPGGSGDLIDHGGPEMPYASVVYIFWGSAWNASDPLVTELQSFRNSSAALITHTGMINQYNAAQSGFVGYQSDVFDPSDPPSTGVTDSMVQQEVQNWFAGSYDYNTIYEVFIPNGYYADDGTGATSCGGPNLQFCAYHSNFFDGTDYVKYSIQPYPSCASCSGPGWTVNENEEHFVCHETREALTDSLGNAWYDATGYEADDKCAWGGDNIFLETASDGHTYGYQMEYSNAVSNCVQ